MSLHPVIRITTFLILVAALARLDLPALLFLLLLFFVFAVPRFSIYLMTVTRFAWRLKWFWLSIILLYALLPQSAVNEQAWFHIDGMWQGVIRCLGLLLIVMYFVLLVHPIPVDRLQAAWIWLMSPLRFIGLSPQKLGLRIGLTFYAVQQLQVQTSSLPALRFRNLPDHLYQFVAHAITQSASAQMAIQQTPVQPESPQWLQWSLPILTMCALTILLWI